MLKLYFGPCTVFLLLFPENDSQPGIFLFTFLQSCHNRQAQMYHYAP